MADAVGFVGLGNKEDGTAVIKVLERLAGCAWAGPKR